VGTLVFTDGTTARTDLIRLNPNVDAYSLDFGGHAPDAPVALPGCHVGGGDQPERPCPRGRDRLDPSQLISDDRHAELSRRLRAAGYPLGSSNVAEHEAIAATQAAIWFFTNDMKLDDRPRNVPVAARRTPSAIDFEFDGARQLGGYTVEVTSKTGASLRLQKSADGSTWRDVASSRLTVTEPGQYRKVARLGQHGCPGTCLAAALRATGTTGWWTTPKAASPWLMCRSGWRGRAPLSQPRPCRPSLRLPAGRAAPLGPAATRWPLSCRPSPAVVDGGLIGPLRLHANDAVALMVSGGSLLDEDGAELSGCEPGGEFYLRPHLGVDEATVTANRGLPAPTASAGRVITGVAHDEVNNRLTPVALAVPAPLVVDFHLQWRARAEQSFDRAMLRAVGG